MSELAFDANGDPIAFPADAEELRVRRFRNPGMRGACEVVHDRDGAPLYMPVDTSYVEFRKLVDGVPGRYRLDPLDASRRVIANSLPAYITITEVVRNAGASSSFDDRDSVIRELTRANADMTKTIADRFASVMQAAADLLRAADGAGLPKREPAGAVAIACTQHDDEDEDDDDDDEDDDNDQEDEVAPPDVASLIAQILPTIQMWLASKAAGTTAVMVPAVAPASAPVPAPVSAPAATPGMVAGESGAAAGMAPGFEPVAKGGSESSIRSTGAPPSDSTARAASIPGVPPPDGAPVRNSIPRPPPAQTAHLLRVYAQLSPPEKRVAQLVVMRMAPSVRAQWLAELSAITVDEAVDLVRSLMPRHRSEMESDS